MRKSSLDGEKLSSAALQLSLSALLSRRFAFMSAKAALRRERREQSQGHKKRIKVHPRLIDEKRIAFDSVDGHWD